MGLLPKITAKCELLYFRKFVQSMEHWCWKWELVEVFDGEAILLVEEPTSWKIYNQKPFEKAVEEIKQQVYGNNA